MTTIHISFAGLAARLVRTLDPIIERTALGLVSTTNPPIEPLTLPTFFRVDIPDERRRTIKDVVSDFQTWLLTSGLRDGIEGIHDFLDDVRLVCALVHETQNGPKKMELWRELTTTKRRAFHKRGLPDKFEFLEKQFGFTVDSTFVAQVLSINSARNCLVHRQGLVSPDHDFTEPGGLRVNWRKFELFAQSEGSERIIDETKPNVEKGEAVGYRIVPRSKLFEGSKRILFTADEFSEICSTILGFGQFVAHDLEAHCKARGLKSVPT